MCRTSTIWRRDDDALIDERGDGIAYTPFFPAGRLQPAAVLDLVECGRAWRHAGCSGGAGVAARCPPHILMIRDVSSVELLREQPAAAELRSRWLNSCA